jgi:hypothetical protein
VKMMGSTAASLTTTRRRHALATTFGIVAALLAAGAALLAVGYFQHQQYLRMKKITLAVQLAAERYGVDHAPYYAQSFVEVTNEGYEAGIPPNPYARGLSHEVPGDSANYLGNFTYYPIGYGREITNYAVVLYAKRPALAEALWCAITKPRTEKARSLRQFEPAAPLNIAPSLVSLGGDTAFLLIARGLTPGEALERLKSRYKQLDGSIGADPRFSK